MNRYILHKFLIFTFLGFTQSRSLDVKSSINPYTKGPYNVDHSSIKPELFGELDHHLEIFTPSSEGTYPVVLFFPGLACTTNAADYSTVLNHIASWGYVVLGPWAGLYNPADTYEAKWVEHVLNWAKVHLDPTSEANYGVHPGVVMDFDNIILGAQSSGSHVAVNFLALREAQDCSDIKAMFLMSPVDGFDPYGLFGETCINPPTKVNFQVPTLIISGGLDSLKGINGLGDIIPACAPEDLSNDRFFHAMTGPTVKVNTTKYGHADCFDDGLYDIVADLHLCATNRDMDRDIYRSYLAGEAVAFMRYFHSGDCDMLPLLTEVGVEDIEGYVEVKGGVETQCGHNTCTWSANPIDFIRL